ncbi:phosphotransferase [Chitinolyticbacter meiyuanensis]|uniref:phosphotransferase n=1 Tax=Chitinolyticbacter meiyuanensis TaxID=682798 RepID=UPI0011E5FCC4|nr:phosphotransferase [Chitinolyticbacter meiyuanensis]
MDTEAWIAEQAPHWFGEAAVQQATFEGFYAKVYQLGLADGRRRMAKSFRQQGMAAREARSLKRLRIHTPMQVAVPEPIALELEVEPQTLVQTYVEGVPSGEVPHEFAALLGEEIVAVLLHWHAQQGDAFEDQQGERHADFASCFSTDLSRLSGWLATADGFGAAIRARILATGELASALITPLAGEPPVFIHDDGHAWNFLADPVSGHLTGVIDPAQARYSHRELDLFHLPDAAPQLDLLNRYLAHSPCVPGWPQRRWLFSLWDDVKHAMLVGWRDEAWFERKLGEFDAALATR